MGHGCVSGHVQRGAARLGKRSAKFRRGTQVPVRRGRQRVPELRCCLDHKRVHRLPVAKSGKFKASRRVQAIQTRSGRLLRSKRLRMLMSTCGCRLASCRSGIRRAQPMRPLSRLPGRSLGRLRLSRTSALAWLATSGTAMRRTFSSQRTLVRPPAPSSSKCATA